MRNILGFTNEGARGLSLASQPQGEKCRAIRFFPEVLIFFAGKNVHSIDVLVKNVALYFLIISMAARILYRPKTD